MLPVQDALPSRLVPWLTLTLVALGATSLLWQMTLTTPELRGLIVAVGLDPRAPSWPAALTSMLLYRDVLHGLANLWALWLFGDNLEDRLGHARFAVFVIACGLVAAAAAVTFDPAASTRLIGPSGAVGAVVGGYFALLPRSRVLILAPSRHGLELVEVSALLAAAFWLVFQGLGQAASAPVAELVIIPLAGAAAGAVAARVLRRADRMALDWWNEPSVR